MPEISLLPSIAPAPVTPAAPAGAASQSAITDPDPNATPSFIHRLRAALHDAHSQKAGAHRASAPKSDAQHADETEQVQPDEDNKNQHAGADASEAAPGSDPAAQQAGAVAVLGMPIPTRALMPAMAPLPQAQAGVVSSSSSTSGTDPAPGLAAGRMQNGQAQVPASVLPSQPLAPMNAAANTNTQTNINTNTGLGQNPAEPAAPTQPSAPDAPQLAATVPAAPANIPASADNTAKPAAPTPERAPAEREGALPQPAARAAVPEAGPQAAPAALASELLASVPVAGATPTGVNGVPIDAPRSKLRGIERGAPAHGTQAVTTAEQPQDATSAQVVGQSPTGSEARTASDQHSSSDSGLAATTSDETLSTAPTASSDATFASHLTNAQATSSPLASSADQSAHASEVATQIAHQADLYRLPGGKGVRIQLHPDDLGGVDVTLRYSPTGGVQLHINVEHAATGQLVQAGWTELRDALAAQGITPDRLMMSVTAPSGSSGLDMSFNGQNGGRAGADLGGFSQGQSGQRQSSSRDDGAGATRTWFSDVDAAVSVPDDGAHGPVAASSHIDYRV